MKSLMALGLSIFIAAPAGATIVLSLDLPELSTRADVIVHGRVVEQTTGWNEAHTRIYTVTSVAVTDRIKGKSASRIRIRQLGGTVDGLSQRIAGNAKLSPGEEVVLFLNHDPKLDLHYVVGMAQGKYAVDRSAGAPQVRANLQGLALVKMEGSQLAAPEDAPDTRAGLSLPAFKAQIKAALTAR